MNVFSKLSKDYTCHELGHTWNPSCISAWISAGQSAYWVAFKTYVSLYLISALIRRQKKDYYLYKFLPEVLRSTAFLGTNGCMFLFGFCLCRKVIRYFYFYQVLICGPPLSALCFLIESPYRFLMRYSILSGGFLPSMLATFVAIQFERKERRSLLAVYTSTMAVDVLYSMAKSRGLVKPLPLGELWYFTPVAACYMYLYKIDKLPSTITSILQKLVGPAERGTGSTAREEEKPPSGLIHQFMQIISAFLVKRGEGGKCKPPWPCRHKEPSCFLYAIEGGIRPFLCGIGLQTALVTISKFRLLLSNPLKFITSLFTRSNLGIGAFLGSFSVIYRACQCFLRRFRQKDANWHTVLSGWLAGWSLLFYRRSSLALYVSSKLVEVMYRWGMTSGVIPTVPYGIILLYCVTTSILFHAIVFEPHNIQKSYYKFVSDLSGGKIPEMNRHLMDEFGTRASLLHPNFWPKYDPSISKLAYHTPESIKKAILSSASS